MRISIHDDPFAAADIDKNWNERGTWPAFWLGCPGVEKPPFVLGFRLPFTVNSNETIRVHVTADERYNLYLDGEMVGYGSERGDRNNWYFETYELALTPGEHLLAARVWALGPKSPFAQMSLNPGFLLAAEGEWVDRLATGIAPWEVKPLEGYHCIDSPTTWGTGANLELDGAVHSWGYERGEGDGWQPALKLIQGSTSARNDRPPTQLLRPATLPPMMRQLWKQGLVRHCAALTEEETCKIPIRKSEYLMSEAPGWQKLISEGLVLTIPPQTNRRILIDLEGYVCAYPEIVSTGGKGASVRIHWQESLCTDLKKAEKGNRSEIEEKYFGTIWSDTDGVGDIFLIGGGEHQRYNTLWWQSGRYVEVVVRTAEEPLTLENLSFIETRYPLEAESKFSAADERLVPIAGLSIRALQMCAHETYFDCPYYEQLMYIGDTRLQALCGYVLTHDSRLQAKSLRMFHASTFSYSGLTESRYPSRVDQTIPPFSLWWITMLHDYAMWRNDPPLIHELLPGARRTMDYFLGRLNDDGLMTAPEGWNFVDWVPGWHNGVPPDGDRGISGILNWQLVNALSAISDLETLVNEPELALRYRRIADKLSEHIIAHFWNDERGLFADDLEHQHFSEHAQCLAILSGQLNGAMEERLGQLLAGINSLTRTTIYFMHYLFETFGKIHQPDAILKRLPLWSGLIGNGLKTTIEMPEPTRSDCHAWGAHPYYHMYATLLGVRPESFGFRKVLVEPQFGRMPWISGKLVHPDGEIMVDLERDGRRLSGLVILPDGIEGTFRYDGSAVPLRSGSNTISMLGDS